MTPEEIHFQIQVVYGMRWVDALGGPEQGTSVEGSPEKVLANLASLDDCVYLDRGGYALGHYKKLFQPRGLYISRWLVNMVYAMQARYRNQPVYVWTMRHFVHQYREDIIRWEPVYSEIALEIIKRRGIKEN